MTVYTKIKLRRDIASDWVSANPTLLAGEIGIDTTNNKIKIGTGTLAWSALSYATLTPTEINNLITGLQNQIDAVASNLSNTLDDYVPVGDVGQPDGVASLDSAGKIPDSEIPAGIARDSEVSSSISTAINNLINSAPGTLDTLGEIATALASDEAAAASLTTLVGTKAPIASPTFTGTVSGITKTMVGLANADNTTDASKPVSTATQTALDLKSPLASPAFTGVPTAPTAAGGTNSTQIATTSYVQDSIATVLALAL